MAMVVRSPPRLIMSVLSSPPDQELNLELSIAQTVDNTEAEGPGSRFAIWVQGCPMRCAGCCNPEMLTFEGGTRTSVRMLADRVMVARDTFGIEGISLLGGEPFAHAVSLAALARRVKAEGLSVMIFSGFTLEEIEAKAEAAEPGVRELLSTCDLLVDGRFDKTQLDTERRWIGSKNQRMHFLTDRYQKDDPLLRSKNTIEIRLRKGELIVNGWPEHAARVAPWRRPKANA